MPRYDREYVGIPAEFARPAGLDPNYRDGYRGLRMLGGAGRAAYGAHRLERHADLETAGGFDGIHSRARGASGGMSYEARWEERGGVSGPTRDPDLIRDFNALSPQLREPPGTEGQIQHEPRSSARDPSWTPPHGYDPRFADRGVPGAGFSEGWARGPARGSR